MSPQPSRTLPESLLVVDDSIVQRRHAVALGRSLGIDLVYEAGNGIEALELLAMLVLPPGAIIVDLEMPGMDGIELVQKLHERHPDVPVIVASSRESALIESVENMGRILGLHVLAGLQKPLTAAALADAFGRRGRLPGAAADQAAEHREPPDVAELRRAIERGEIVAHYQPKVDVRTGIVRGVEVLARWQHPERGMVYPDDFIPLAEQEGLILPLTLAVTAHALAQASAWNAGGLKLSMAVNLSARLLDAPDLVQRIAALLGSHGVPANQLVVEITESSVVDYIGIALGALARLRLMGCGLSIDDYGTGFSSMQQLARIPFTELKIDRSFVHGAHRKRNLRVILESALDMARRLGLVSVAEGIETLEDWRLLQEFGCTTGQGYLIGRPMPAAELPGWMKKHQAELPRLRSALTA